MKYKWNETYYVRVYELIKSGLSEAATADALGISLTTFIAWKSKHPALMDAITRARKSINNDREECLADCIYNRLPTHLKELWERVNLCMSLENGISRAEALLQEAGRKARQHLFVYALAHTHFNLTESCRAVNISKRTLDAWISHDPDFSELLDEINWHKKNFYESALINAVKEGETTAIIHANKTYNRDRGYGEVIKLKGEIDHSHEHRHAHAHVDLDQLNLPLDTRREILNAIRKQKQLENKETENGTVP